MTTYTNFVPSTVAPFEFQPVLDGQTYRVVVTWLLFGARFYINVFALDGTLVVSRALVGSPSGIALQALSWAGGLVTATASAPHGYRIGSIVELTISGAAPDAYNGQVQAYIVSPVAFTYPLASDPGMASVFGAASYNLNLVGGYFSSTLVYRAATQQFEVNP